MGFQPYNLQSSSTQSNGQVERTIQTIKTTLYKVFENNEDPYLALLSIRSAHGLSNNTPPTTLFFNRTIRTIILSLNETSNMENNKVTNQQRYPVVSKRPLPELQPNAPVRIHNNSSWRVKGKILKKLTAPPRSSLVLAEKGTILRRKMKYLLLIEASQNCPYLRHNCCDYDDLETNLNENLCEYTIENNSHQEYRICSGRLIKLPVRYNDSIMS